MLRSHFSKERESPSLVKGVRLRLLSLRGSWVQIPSPALYHRYNCVANSNPFYNCSNNYVSKKGSNRSVWNWTNLRLFPESAIYICNYLGIMDHNGWWYSGLPRRRHGNFEYEKPRTRIAKWRGVGTWKVSCFHGYTE